MVAAPAFAQRDGGPRDVAARELPEFVPGSMWVKLDQSRPEFHDATMRVVRTLAGTETTKTFWLVPGLHLVRVPVGSERALVSLMRELEGVEWTSVEGVGTTTQETCEHPNRQCEDEYCADQYWIDSINLRDAWAQLEGMQLPLVTVAVIDSGVNYNHPDLIGNMWVNPGETPANLIDDDANGIVDDVHGAAFVMPPLADPCNAPNSACFGLYDNDECTTCEPGPGNPLDKQAYDFTNDAFCGIDTSMLGGNHGTACAAIIAARADSNEIRGIACNLRIMALRVYHRCFLTAFAESDYVEALQYAVEYDVSVVSSSLQLLPPHGTGNAMYNAVKNLAYHDIVYVTSSGNAGQNVDAPLIPVAVLPPQQFNWDHMLTVGATDSSDNLWVDSNWGPQTVDLMAPGVAIRVFSDTTVNSGPSMPLVTGTSFAAPMVAGAAALFRSLNPAASAQATVDAVRSSVRVVPGLAGTCVSGGVLDVNNLITP